MTQTIMPTSLSSTSAQGHRRRSCHLSRQTEKSEKITGRSLLFFGGQIQQGGLVAGSENFSWSGLGRVDYSMASFVFSSPMSCVRDFLTLLLPRIVKHQNTAMCWSQWSICNASRPSRCQLTNWMIWEVSLNFSLTSGCWRLLSYFVIMINHNPTVD